MTILVTDDTMCLSTLQTIPRGTYIYDAIDLGSTFYGQCCGEMVEIPVFDGAIIVPESSQD